MALCVSWVRLLAALQCQEFFLLFTSWDSGQGCGVAPCSLVLVEKSGFEDGFELLQVFKREKFEYSLSLEPPDSGFV